MTTQTETRNIILGVCGGIAAYKAAHVASRLTQAGHRVTVTMTRSAQKFITPLTFASLTGTPTITETFPEIYTDPYPHLHPTRNADTFILLPATANIIAKAAHGIGDEIVSTSILSLKPECARYFCPAMNTEMWHQDVVRQNAAQLCERGWIQIGPATGRLGCGDVGEGRMAEPETILDCVMNLSRPLKGRTLLICSGPTVEHLDPVRFISNHSSGKMGKAIALATANAGAVVEFVTGPVGELPQHRNIRITHVLSAAEMLTAAEARFAAADAAVFVAAVADYTPVAKDNKKEAKQDQVTLQLTRTPDIAASLSRNKRNTQVCIGFALETHDAGAKARCKLGAKHLDAIVLNDQSSFGCEAGNFHLFQANGTEAGTNWGHISKTQCARNIVDLLAAQPTRQGMA